MTHFFIIFSLAIFLAGQLSAQTWVRGALYLHAIDGAVTLTELGGEPLQLEAEQLPLASSALVNCSAEHGASAFFSASNRSHIYFEGEGSFAVERLEQIAPESAAWEAQAEETGQSRMIINFRDGTLIVDNRNMVDSSQCVVETPLGRISVGRSLWRMQIVFEPRSQIFNFTLICSSGRVRFTDLQGQQYTLRAGQRLTGAGSRTAPSVGLGEITDQGREQMELYRILAKDLLADGNDLALFLPYLQPLANRASQASGIRKLDPAKLTRRPIVIEHARQPDPVTPFRGDLVPPTSGQADLF